MPKPEEKLRRAREDLDKIVGWLAAHAPKTHASLAPPIDAQTLRAALEPLGRPVPKEIIRLYGICGGQKVTSDKAAVGIFNGYWFMPLEGVDGLKQAWTDWQIAQEGGAEWATSDRFPFAKDFAGAYLCFERAKPDDDDCEEQDEDDDEPDDEEAAAEKERLRAEGLDELGYDLEDEATIVYVNDDDEDNDDPPELEVYLGCLRIDIEEATFVIDERVTRYETHVVQFDACKPRQVGDIAHHSVFDALGIRATIEDIAQIFGLHDKKPETLFGLAVRLEGPTMSHGDILSWSLTDNQETPIRSASGKGSGGGKPGVLVYVWSKRPFAPGSRLRVEFQQPVKT